MAKAVMKKKNGLPAELEQEMAGDAGDGAQGITTADMAIPFLRILQKMSPQVSKRDGAYIQDAEEGMILNTVTSELFNEIRVIPCGFNFKIIEWKLRDDGGGFITSFARGDQLPDTTPDDRGRAITDDGTQLSDTAEHYVLIVFQDGHVEQALIAMGGTQLKHSRKWNSLIQQQMIQTPEGQKIAPTYSRIYNLSTAGESNDKGDWSGWNIKLEGVVEDIDLYRSAKAFSQSVSQGTVKVKHTNPNEETDVPF
jgi:hypothetical protein